MPVDSDPVKATHKSIDTTIDHVLEIDALLNLHIDQQRRQPLNFILEGVIQIVAEHAGLDSLWIQYDSPRTFDGNAPEQITLMSPLAPREFTTRLAELTTSFRQSTGKPPVLDEPLLAQVEGNHVYGVPMFVDGTERYMGIVGLAKPTPISPIQIRLIQQIASRIDTAINFKNIAAEHKAVLVLVNQALDREGLDGIGETLLLLQELCRAPKAAIIFWDNAFCPDVPTEAQDVILVYAEDGELTKPPAKSFVLHEGLGGNLIAYEGDVSQSKQAMMALGVIDREGAVPRYFHVVDLFDRTSLPAWRVGKLFLVGGPPLDSTDRDIMEACATQLDTKIVHYQETKRNLSRSLSPTQVDFFVRHPKVASWFFETPRKEEIAMVFTDICGYTEITRRQNDPKATIQVAKEWILEEIELTAKHGGYFDKEVGDCAISLFGPPFYELTTESLLAASDVEDLERLMQENPPDPERYAYHAVLYALESLRKIRDFRMADCELELSIGIEVQKVAIGDLNGHLGSLTAMGDGMNLAARLQGLAGRGEIVIGPNCRKRLEGYCVNNLAQRLPFHIEDAGEANLKGYDEPVQYSRVREL